MVEEFEVSEDGRVTVDREADAAYLYLRGVGEVDRTVALGDVNVDLDAAGVPVGVELLSLGAPVPLSLLEARFELTVADLQPLLDAIGV